LEEMLARSRKMDHSYEVEIPKRIEEVMNIGTFQSKESSINLGKIINLL
jgi:hypothetical protein